MRQALRRAALPCAAAAAAHVAQRRLSFSTCSGGERAAGAGNPPPRKDRPLEFFIFGHPVTMSPSPEVHNIGFRENGFPHRYGRFDAPDVETVVEKLKSESCGGGSVTIPHKESLLPHMDGLSESARVIGAVNTITKSADGALYADNTDWLGIKNQLETRMECTGLSAKSGGGLVCLLCGSGGTARAAAFAFQRMNAKRVIIYNRTTSRAKALAEEFGFEVCEDLRTLDELPELHIVVNTLPGSTGFELPSAAVLERCRPVVLEAAYIPRRTAFVKQAMAAGCEIVEGVEMLFEQGCAQCEIWTGRPAPRAKIAANLVRELFGQGSAHPAFAKMEPQDVLPVSLQREARDAAP